MSSVYLSEFKYRGLSGGCGYIYVETAGIYYM
jgi:hypothetical protein